MRLRLKHWIFIGILLLLLPLLIGQVFTSGKEKPQIKVVKPVVKREVNPHLERAINDFETQFEMLMMSAETPGAAVAIVKDSTIVYLKGFGLREWGTKDSVDTHTVFRLASVSKCFASFLTGILVEDSLLQWNDSVKKYVPGFRLNSEEATDALTVRHVLSHTTGLPMHAYTNLVEEGLPLQDLLKRLEDVPLAAKVGDMYSYQNVAYSIVAEVIQYGTGKSYEAWMKEQVFNPLGMRDASLDYISMVSNPNIAKPHMPRKGGWKKVSINNTYYNVAPAGGVNASISDMAQWMVALLGHKENVISNATLTTLFSPVVKAPSKNRNYRKVNRYSDSFYGLGWRILHYPDDTLVYHGGFVNGYRSEVAVDPKEDIAVCILTNAPGALADNGIPLFFNIYKEYRHAVNEWDENQRAKAPVLDPASL